MENLKIEGNELFKSNKYEEALEKYREGIELIEEKDDINLSILHSNISATLCKMEKYNEALEHAVASTRCRPDWFKAWYRLSMVLYKLEKYEQAEKSIEKTLECCKKENIEEKFIIDLQSQILQKLNNKPEEENEDQENLDYKVLNEAMNREQQESGKKMPDLNSMMPIMNDMLQNDMIKNKLSDPKFQEKMLKSQSNPFEMLADPDMKDIMGEMMKNINLK